MTTAAMLVPDLVEQVGRVHAVDLATLDRARHEALTAPSCWVAEYGEHQSGGWWTLSLFNATGDPQDVEIADCDPVETSLLHSSVSTLTTSLAGICCSSCCRSSWLGSPGRWRMSLTAG